MIINKDKFDPEDTEVLFNKRTISIQLDHFFNSKKKLPSITKFKNKFGRQLKTWIGGSESRRFYIWTFKMEETLLYALVHNVAGVIWEYPSNTNKKNLENIHKEVYRILSK